jgi:putative ABC transport system permease protein
MASIGPELDWRLAVAVAALAALAVVAARVGRLPTARRSVTAVARAVVQLLAVAGIIHVVFERRWAAAAFVGVMFVVASSTSASRSEVRRSVGWVGIALACGAAPVVAIIFGTGASPLTAPTIIAICGIVIGNSMTACSLVLRRAFAGLRERRGEVDAALALGLDRRRALGLVVDRDRPEALVPVLDSTRTVGLVTLPGAFIGVLLGGGSAADAAAAQLIVLVGLVAAQTITIVVAARLVSAGRLLPADIGETLPAA